MRLRLRHLPLVCLGAVLWAQQAPPLRVNVRLVSVFVNVTDTNGAPVAGLTRDDFLVSDDAHPQQIAVFEKQSEVPLSLVLAIDTSGSTRKDAAVEQKAAHDFVRALLRPVDQMALFEFNSDVREVVGFTNSPRRIDEGLGSLGKGPATAFYSAVFLASQSLGMLSHGAASPRPVPRRKVLLLISDGSNTVAGTTYAEALEQALRGEVMIYSIIDVPIAADAGRDTGGEHAMITLAEQTGGKYYYADASGLEAAFRHVSDDLRTQYLLGYYPHGGLPGAGAFHTISVQLAHPQHPEHPDQLHFRSGYYSVPIERADE
jgi:Ca-activated chloride channel family protein